MEPDMRPLRIVWKRSFKSTELAFLCGSGRGGGRRAAPPSPNLPMGLRPLRGLLERRSLDDAGLRDELLVDALHEPRRDVRPLGDTGPGVERELPAPVRVPVVDVLHVPPDAAPGEVLATRLDGFHREPGGHAG